MLQASNMAPLREALLLAVAGSALSQCLPSYNNAIRASVNGALIAWDLSHLCRGDQAYTATNKANQNFSFQVGGTANTTLCSWDPSVSQYNSIGVAVMFFGSASPDKECINWSTGEEKLMLPLVERSDNRD